MNTKEKIRFWEEEARRSLAVAHDLLKFKRNLEALFFGHLALEKLLKAKVAKVTGKDPVYSHDLLVLAKQARLRLTQEEKDFLARVNVYNIRTRYQDYKRSLHRQATSLFTNNEVSNIKTFFKKIAI